MRKLIILLLIALTSIISFSQSNNEYRLAMEYYKAQEYEKALFYFEKLASQNPRSTAFFDYYIRCLTELEDYNEAEKEIKKRIRKNRSNYKYYIDLGSLYRIQGLDNEAADQFEKALNTIRPDQNYISRMANTFRAKRENQYAEKTYLEGRKLLKGSYTFNFELGNLYYYQRNYEKMIDEYLDMLLISEAYLQSVQNRLQTAVYNDIDNNLTELLKANLLRRTQKHPDKVVYNELLIWLFVQDKDFQGAFIQAKALDKRLGESGERIVGLARMATNNDDFNTALEAYQYVIDKGHIFEYYYPARKEFLEVLYQRVIYSKSVENIVYEELEKNFENFLNEFGKDNQTALLVTKLAHLKGFYLDKASEAIATLEEMLKYPSLDNENAAKCMLELADIYVLNGDVYDAALLYAKIEEENKNNPNGYEAKFRRARLAYYMGNFAWSKALLDVLKASTSKLISNDAFGLSLLISDNTFSDSLEYPMMLFAEAELLSYQQNDSLALLKLDTLQGKYFTHSLQDEVYFKKAQIHIKNREYLKAVNNLEELLKGFEYDILADEAAFLLATIYEEHLSTPEKARELYKRIMLDYPSSIYVVEARKRFRLLRGDEIQ